MVAMPALIALPVTPEVWNDNAVFLCEIRNVAFPDFAGACEAVYLILFKFGRKVELGAFEAVTYQNKERFLFACRGIVVGVEVLEGDAIVGFE